MRHAWLEMTRPRLPLSTLLLLLATSPFFHAGMAQSLPSRKSETLRSFPLTKFYDTPLPLQPGTPGELIRSLEFEEYNLPEGVSAVRILYHSRSGTNQDVTSSGVVLYPEQAQAPTAGWPVIAWAHPWAGVARDCAPSLQRNLAHASFLAMYVRLGYAVVVTDYAGLGTNFHSAFGDIRSNAKDVIYSVAAARHAVPRLGARWIAMGTGDAAATAVAVAEAERDISDPNFLGAIAISGLRDLQDAYAHANDVSAAQALFLAHGIRAFDPQFSVGELLIPKALPAFRQIEQSCSEPQTLAGSEILKPNWRENQQVREYFDRNRTGMKPARGPILVISSEAEPALTQAAHVVARLCSQHDRLQFQKYSESDPTSVIGDSVRDQIGWIQARFAGKNVPVNCPAH